MKRRQALATLAASTVAVPAFGASEGGSKKKGWCGGNVPFHKTFGAQWYYTWSPKTRPSTSTEFVPMIKGEWSLKGLPAIQKMGGIGALLGFNEPERKKQGNLSVAKAIELWPQLVELASAKKLRLGSPAPSSDRGGLAWLDAFMKEAKRRSLHTDFVALHYYRSHDARDFESFVKTLARQYRKPLWITEFNGWSGSEAEHHKFLKASLKFLERNDDVERYAYFNPAAGKPHSLVDRDGAPTRLGELYREV